MNVNVVSLISMITRTKAFYWQSWKLL